MSKFTIKDLHKIMQEVNAPNECTLTASLRVPTDTFDYAYVDSTFMSGSVWTTYFNSEYVSDTYPYWVFYKPYLKVRDISAIIADIRQSRYDIFIDGLYAATEYYSIEHINSDFYLIFNKVDFPELNNVMINGDIELT